MNNNTQLDYYIDRVTEKVIIITIFNDEVLTAENQHRLITDFNHNYKNDGIKFVLDFKIKKCFKPLPVRVVNPDEDLNANKNPVEAGSILTAYISAGTTNEEKEKIINDLRKHINR